MTMHQTVDVVDGYLLPELLLQRGSKLFGGQQIPKSSICKYAPGNRTGWLPLVLLPMKHIVVVYSDLRGQGQATGFANQHIPADFPMGAGLAFTNQEFDFFLIAHLQPPEFFFYFSYKIGESRRRDDGWLPTQILVN
jgi:hypothetical protein